MAKVPVFISFDYDHDVTLKEFIVGQAKLKDSPFEIDDAHRNSPESLIEIPHLSARWLVWS